MILAPGGGWLTSHNMLALLRGRRRIIYLKVRPETALQRLGPNLATRPLLRCADPLDRLRQLLAEREPGYRLADFVIDTDVLTLQEVIDRLALLASADIEG